MSRGQVGESSHKTRQEAVVWADGTTSGAVDKIGRVLGCMAVLRHPLRASSIDKIGQVNCCNGSIDLHNNMSFSIPVWFTLPIHEAAMQ